MTILVTGATGTNASRAPHHLQDLDIPVRGDLGEIETVQAALSGVSALFPLVPNLAA